MRFLLRLWLVRSGVVLEAARPESRSPSLGAAPRLRRRDAAVARGAELSTSMSDLCDKVAHEPQSTHGTGTLYLRRNDTRRVGAWRHTSTEADAGARRGGGARRAGRARRLRGRRASPARLHRLLARGGAGGDRRADVAHPAHERGDGAQLGRSGASLPGFRDARPALERAGRDHGRTWIVHRVVPTVRLRPRRL